MLRRLRSWIAAVFVLSAVLAWIEVGLRIHEAASTVARPSSTDSPTSLAIVPSTTAMWELRPTGGALDASKPEGWRINSSGCRGLEFAIPKPDGAFRLVCLGGGRILAPFTAELETLPAELHRRLSPLTQIPLEVVNAGQPHGSPLSAWLRCRRELAGWEPDLCLLTISLTDWLHDAEIRRYLVCDAQGVPVSAANPATAARRQTHPIDIWRRELKTLDWCWQQAPWCRDSTVMRTTSVNEAIWTKSVDQTADLQSGLVPIQLLQRLCDRLSCRLIVFITPEPWELSASATNDAEIRQWAGVRRGQRVSGAATRAWVIRSLREANIEAVDMTVAFPQGKAADVLFHADALEWTAHGQTVVAGRLAEYITQRVPGPWSNGYFQQPIKPVSAQLPMRPE